MKVLLTGGGTGGHVYPALAIAEALRLQPKAQPLSLVFVGTKDRLEARIVPKTDIPLWFVTAAPLRRGRPLALFRTLALNAIGVLQMLLMLHRFRPDFVVATGGYVAFPVVAAMRLVRALGLTRGKIGLLEPNVHPGLTNRLLTPLVDELWVSHAPGQGTGRSAMTGMAGMSVMTGTAGKSVLTGTPVRSMFASLPRPEEARSALGLDPRKTTIVVMGGSQGARSLNTAFGALELPVDQQVLLLTGEQDETIPVRPGIVIRPYLDDPRAAYAAADLVVARAGASTLAELAATRTPALLVPYPHATDGHQMHNAARYASIGAARVILDADLCVERLVVTLRELLEPEALAAMRRAASSFAPPDASERIARRVVDLVGEKRRAS